MTYSLHQAAKGDLRAVLLYYRSVGGPRLSGRFLDEFERVAGLLVEFPGIGFPIDPLRRVFTLQGFPYSLIYREQQGGIRILVVRHHHRHPDFGQSRR